MEIQCTWTGVNRGRVALPGGKERKEEQKKRRKVHSPSVVESPVVESPVEISQGRPSSCNKRL